ncbi:hypothetical protein J6590_016933 [Homalodisca vitripennis]|nr:hypothetical protein J6590_016933 [Homalodisca vitripennis]
MIIPRRDKDGEREGKPGRGKPRSFGEVATALLHPQENVRKLKVEVSVRVRLRPRVSITETNGLWSDHQSAIAIDHHTWTWRREARAGYVERAGDRGGEGANQLGHRGVWKTPQVGGGSGGPPRELLKK